MNAIILPWPPMILSPNSRAHWGSKIKPRKRYRKDCYYATKSARIDISGIEGPLHLWIDFFPPNKRRRDVDNIIASCKAGLDGVADALGVNDNRFVLHPRLSDETGGIIQIRITAGPSP